MPFGFVTKAELNRYREELRSDFAQAVADQKKLYDKIELEWNDMFDRFRRLYAKLAKREKTDDVGEPSSVAPGDGAGVATPPSLEILQRRRAMRGW